MVQVREAPRETSQNNNEILVYCHRCRDYYTTDAALGGKTGRLVLHYDPNPHLVHLQNRSLRCHCGGRISFFVV